MWKMVIRFVGNVSILFSYFESFNEDVNVQWQLNWPFFSYD